MSNPLSTFGKIYANFRFYLFILVLIIIFIIVCLNIYDGIIFKYRYNKKTNKECNIKKKCETNEICKGSGNTGTCYIKDSKKTQSLLKSFISFIVIFVIIGFYYLAKFSRNFVVNNDDVATIYGGYSIFNIFRKL